MRLKHLTLTGFRGAPIEVTLDLDGKSCFVYAENGFGKTTLVDGLEYWSTGDVEAYHREGALIDSLINLDSNVATVTCAPMGRTEISRILKKSGGGRGKEAPPDPGLATIAPIPILRHKTMADFMAKSAGEKKDILLEILGLGNLSTFRDVLTTASNDAKAVATATLSTYRAESSALQSMCTSGSLVDTAEALRTLAGLSESITSQTQLELLDITPARTAGTPNFTELIAAIDRTRDLSEVNSSIDQWNTSLGDEAQSSATIINDLLIAGGNAIEVWSYETCPLCEQSVDKTSLSARIPLRIEELKIAVAARIAVQTELTETANRIQDHIQSLMELVKQPPQGGWQDSGAIDQAIIDLDAHLVSIRSALSMTEKCERLAKVSVPESDALRNAVRDASTDSEGIRALMALVGLRDQHLRESNAKNKNECAQSVATTFQTLLSVTTDRIQREVEVALASLSDLVSNYYSLLRTSGLYTGIKLSYTTSRSGGVEFHVEFDGRHDVTPPHRVMSESQLNSLGLALFLARLKQGDQPWNFFVLDDVVNSFDADHRMGLATLIQQEFPDWQVLFLTHDRFFQSLARDIFNDWIFASIGAWTAFGGPIFTRGSSLDLLKARLADGRSAAELGGVARMALEEGLSRPLAKLELPIRYDPFNRFSARDFLDALRGGLKRAETDSLRNLDVLKRMSAETYVSNLAAHHRPTDPLPTVQELSRVASDLTELHEAFRCSSCDSNVWKLFNDSRHSWQCSCGALKC